MFVRLAAVTIAVIGVLALSVAGCGGDDGDTSPAEEEPATPASTEEASLPKPISVEGAKRVDLSDRLLTRISIPSPDWMVFAFGSLWVKRDDGRVVRVDPETSKVLAEIGPGPLGQHSCQGIGASDEAIWSCPPGVAIQRIDPEANSVAATIRIDKLQDQGRLVSAADRVWALTDSGAKLTAIDPRTDRPAERVALGGRCAELATAGDALWAMCPLEDRLVRIDAKAREVSDELALPGATNASVGDDLWVGFEGGVAQVDPRTLDVLAVYDVHPRYGGSIFAADEAVWVREEGGGFLTRIDPEAQRIVETIRAPALPSGGDVVQIDDSVWATAYDDATLVELSAGP
jgi:streptogramin lyase